MATTFRPSIGPSPEVMRYFDEKQLRPSFNWREVWAEEHANAFTVAKSAGFDILEDVRGALSSALADGKTFRQFQDELEPALRAEGWWGKRRVTDPATGEPIIAQLGSPRRLKVIYEANVRSARAAGQWERAQRTKRMLPYFQYGLGPSDVHRPYHVAIAGIILPVDDPFWDTHFPPNGWGCKCWLRQITRSAADAAGGVSKRPEVILEPYQNRRRPDVGPEQIPRGIDPGWHTNPGKARARGYVDRMSRRVEAEGEQTGRDAISELWQLGYGHTLATIAQRIHLPVGVSSKVQTELKANTALVVVSNTTIRTMVADHAEVKIEDFGAIQLALDEGLYTGVDHNGGYRYWTKRNGYWWRLVLHRSTAGFMVVRSWLEKRRGPPRDELE